MKTIILASALAVVLTGHAQAQRLSNLTGQRLVGLCTSRDPSQIEGCTAYIDGVADAAAFYQRLRPSDGSKGGALPGYVCVPGATTGVQLRQTVVDWFRKHQEQASRQASGIVLRALDDTYLCPGEQRHLAPGE